MKFSINPIQDGRTKKSPPLPVFPLYILQT